MYRMMPSNNVHFTQGDIPFRHSESQSLRPFEIEEDILAEAPGPSALHSHQNASPSLQNLRTEPFQSFIDDIADVLEQNMVGLHETAHYIPDKEVKRLVTPTNIARALGITLGSDHRRLVQYITDTTAKTFLITVLAIFEPGMRFEAMTAFYTHGFTDSCLPVTKMKKGCLGSSPSSCGSGCIRRGPRQCEGLHDATLDCFHHNVWTKRTFQVFKKDQWIVILQHFDKNVFEYAFENERILPFLRKARANREKGGNFAFVQHARILANYQNTIDISGQMTIDIAIKTLRLMPDKDYNIRNEWRNEVAAHRELGDLDKMHLVQAIGAYQQAGQYCLLFEWADGGDLRSYWKTADHPGLSAGLIREYLTQLRGLTSALDTMHNTRQARSRRESKTGTQNSLTSTNSTASGRSRHIGLPPDVETMSNPIEDDVASVGESEQSYHGPQIAIEDHGESPNSPKSPNEPAPNHLGFGKLRRSSTLGEENWRHGDVKPDNILRFINGAHGLGVLKLADLGRAKHNDLVTKDRGQLEWDKWRTKPYEPPDLYILSEKYMSRLFDVWSLGCVFFESILWMLYGKDWLQNFAKTTKSADQNETPFWIRIRETKSARISPLVQTCIDHMLSSDPECIGPQPTALRDLLHLVYSKMLVIDLPAVTAVHTPGKRANTETILKDLDAIIEKSNHDSYVFTGKTRPDPSTLPDIVAKVPAKGLELSKAPNHSVDFLAVPGATNHGRSRTQRWNTYSDVPVDSWKYEDDDSFARQVYHCETDLDDEECLESEDALCGPCQRMDICSPHLWKSRPLGKLKGSCALCAILIARGKAAGLTKEAFFSFNRNDAWLTIVSSETLEHHNIQLRLCRSLADGISFVHQSLPFVPMGLPRLSKIGSKVSLTLLRAWLDDCNDGHGEKDLECMDIRPARCRPKRLIDVGSSADQRVSRIVYTSSLTSDNGLRYLALSHPWGKKTAKNPHFVSTNENINQFEQGIPDDALPANFRDAVEITRQLKQRYLWIDALCILQWSPNHPGDFAQESSSMQDIFSSAYCVLAASSATDMTSGLLHCKNRVSRTDRKAVAINGGESTGPLFICDSPDDFQHDVIDSPLNSRAWVLQERALARRTIFFTTNQIYWECSGGFRCETMSKLANSSAALLGDSNFPAYAVEEQTKGAQLYFWQHLYAAYCGLQLTHKTDKPFAISGLEQRLAERFQDTNGAGVFGKQQGRSLLWIRANDGEKLQRISFADSQSGTHNPPTWSFMAHVGPITYIKVPGRTANWEKLDLRLTGNGEDLWFNAKDPLLFKATALEFERKAPSDGKLCLLVYDDPDADQSYDKCVIIGKVGDILSYILVVRPRDKKKANEGLYERAGAGYIPSGWIDPKGIAVEIV